MTGADFNYYNYFTEIEDFFIQKRGKHILLSPLDWILIETWKNMGVPLHVALRGIERSVSLFNEKESRHRYVNTLYYCNQSVLEEHEQYLLGMEGAHPAVESEGANDSFPSAGGTKSKGRWNDPHQKPASDTPSKTNFRNYDQ